MTDQPTWEGLLGEIEDLASHDDRSEIRAAWLVVSRIDDVMRNSIAGEWRVAADAMLAPALRRLKGALNALVSMPSDSAYVGLSSATVDTVKTLPALRELEFLASQGAAGSMLSASRALEQRIAIASDELVKGSDKFARLLSLSADDTLARSYASYASTEAEKADRWRVAAVAVFGAAVALAAFVVFRSLSDSTNLEDVVGRLGLSGALAALGAYLQHQSALHRRREGEARSLEMKLTTLGPFSADLPPEGAAKVRAAVGLAIFAEPAAGSSDPAAEPGDHMVRLPQAEGAS